MPAPLMTIETDDRLPDDADIVVIGGGIIGACAGYFLARRGVKVVLVEKGRVGAEQSSRNWGWCRQQNRDARELPMATRSLALWDALSTDVGATGFRRCGLLYLSDNDAELDGWARWRDFARTVGVVTHMLSGDEAAARGSATGKRWKGGVFSPTDGIADPAAAVPAIAAAIVRAGGRVIQNCAARGLDLAGGRVCGVITEHGRIRAPIAVMAGGAWASSFCRQVGVRFPQASIRASILAVSGADGIPPALHTSAVSVTARSDGGHTLAISGKARVDPTAQMLRFGSTFVPMFLKRHRFLALGGLQGWSAGHETLGRWSIDEPTPMERTRILDPRPDRGQIDETLSRARGLLPGLAASRVTAAWAGYIDSTPDGVPAIGETGIPGLVLAAGFSGHGFGIGPGAGELLADLLTGTTPAVDARPYDPARFSAAAWGKVADF